MTALRDAELLSRMGHDLRTPLNAILGFAQLLEMDDLSPEQRESVTEIQEAGTRLLDLINGIVDVAKAQTGSLSLTIEPVPVGEVVRECSEELRSVAGRKDVALQVELDGLEGAPVLADRKRLQQILLILLSNALGASPQDGRVTVRASDAETARLRLEVSDTGPGIPKDDIPRLFVAFQRSSSERAEGSGVDLPLAKGLAEAMGGALDAESAPGAGTTFWVELPRVAGSARSTGT